MKWRKFDSVEEVIEFGGTKLNTLIHLLLWLLSTDDLPQTQRGAVSTIGSDIFEGKPKGNPYLPAIPTHDDEGKLINHTRSRKILISHEFMMQAHSMTCVCPLSQL